MTLSPQQRRHCLDIMGITAYRPRQGLPGAAPGRIVSWPPEPVAPQTATDRPGPAPAWQAGRGMQAAAKPQQPPVSAKALLEEPVAGSTSGPQVVPPPLSEQPVGEQDSTLRYRVVLIPVNKKLSVMEELPANGEARMPAGHLRLLGRILHSLGMPQQPGDMRQLPFQWPMVDSGHIDASATAGRRSLRIFAESNLPDEPEHVLWLMGEGLIDLFGLAESHQPLERVTGQPWRLLATAGLGQMRRVPTLKRELRQPLKLLRRFLDGTSA